ncbi:MAG: hypothetical protein QE285_12645 [Aquabacterium sp.]|nr:hypothetical protein [Aquabacterium sp.]
MTLASLVLTVLSPPVGVLVVLVMPRSGRMVVDVDVTVAQSLPGLASPCAGGLAWPAGPPAGIDPPVQAWLRAAPATVAVVVMRKAGSGAFTARVLALGCSHTTAALTSAHDQPLPVALTNASPDSTSTTRSGPVATRGPPLVTVMVDTMSDPNATGLGVLVLDRRRSAPSGRTATFTDPLLLPVLPSGVSLRMLAVLVKVLPPGATVAGAVATTVMLSVLPCGKLARVQVTTWPVAPQAQPVLTADTKPQPAGRVSVTTAFTAAEGPSLRGWIWKLTLLPAVAGCVEVTDFCAIRTSAPGMTGVSTVATLLLGTGSSTPPVAGSTDAVLVMVPPAAVTRPVMVTGGADAPTASVPARLQVTTPALWPQAQPVPVAVRKLTDGGRLSVMTIAPPALGPLLLAVRV